MAATTITFNSYDMQSSTVMTQEIDDGSAFDREVTAHKLLRMGGAVVTDATYYTKTIAVKGMLLGTSAANAEALIDTFQTQMAVMDKNLDIGYGGSTRRYVCTPTKVSVKRPNRGSYWANFEVDFLATEYGRDTSTTALLSASANTSASRTIGLTVGGSAPDQLLRFQVTVTAATGLTNKYITITNDTTETAIQVVRTWVVGDVLEVDVANTTVKVNGTLVDFNGAFPYFTPGTHDSIMTNDFTTRTLTTTIDYTKRYL